jgi:hypothetical protein
MAERDVYRALSLGAKSYFLGLGGRQPSSKEALAALRSIAAGLPVTGVGFEDPLHEDTALRRLVTIAFEATPEEIFDRENGSGNIWSAVIERFSIFLLTLEITGDDAENISAAANVPQERPIEKETTTTGSSPSTRDYGGFKVVGLVVGCSLLVLLAMTNLPRNPSYPGASPPTTSTSATANPTIGTSAASASLIESANRMLALAQATNGSAGDSEEAKQRNLNCKVIRMTLAISQRPPDADESMALSRCTY